MVILDLDICPDLDLEVRRTIRHNLATIEKWKIFRKFDR